MAETLNQYVRNVLREHVPPGKPNSSQRIARDALANLLLALWAPQVGGDSPPTVRSCIDVAELAAQIDDPDFVFAYDEGLLRTGWYGPAPLRV